MGRRPLDGLDDVLIAGATAEIPLNATSNLGFAWLRIPLQELISRKYHARGAVATLQSVFFPETLLNGVEFSVLSQALNGHNIGPVGLDGQHGAGFH